MGTVIDISEVGLFPEAKARFIIGLGALYSVKGHGCEVNVVA